MISHQPNNVELSNTAQHWDEHNERFRGRKSGLFWWDVPEINRYRNALVSGWPDVDWVSHTLQTHFADRLPLDRCLSLGCGNGHLERTLARRNAFQHCDAYDIGPKSIADARQLAEEEGLSMIDYAVADLNVLELPEGTYDAVWVNSAMHHFQALERVSEQIRRSLKPSGLLILNEYVGPSRFQFPDRQKEAADCCLNLIPRQYRIRVAESVELETQRLTVGNEPSWLMKRTLDKARDGDLIEAVARKLKTLSRRRGGQVVKDEVRFPSARDVVAVDPSEAIRSDEIISILERHFEIVEFKGLGGNILQFLLADIAGNFSDEDPTSIVIMRMLTQIEQTLITANEFADDFAYIVATPLNT